MQYNQKMRMPCGCLQTPTGQLFPTHERCGNEMTLVLADIDDVAFSDAFVVQRWMPDVRLIGPEKIPALDPVAWPTSVRELVRFRDRPMTASTSDSVVHFYASDDKLRSVLANPRKTLGRVQSFAAVITPDFSMYRNLPRHQRVFHTWSNRAVGALYQSHGMLTSPEVVSLGGSAK